MGPIIFLKIENFYVKVSHTLKMILFVLFVVLASNFKLSWDFRKYLKDKEEIWLKSKWNY